MSADERQLIEGVRQEWEQLEDVLFILPLIRAAVFRVKRFVTGSAECDSVRYEEAELRELRKAFDMVRVKELCRATMSALVAVALEDASTPAPIRLRVANFLRRLIATLTPTHVPATPRTVARRLVARRRERLPANDTVPSDYERAFARDLTRSRTVALRSVARMPVIWPATMFTGRVRASVCHN
jgi:hypothetical protein